MNLRFNTAAGFLAAATLLSGSAFAFAPEFDTDLPTVIITDRLEAPSMDFDSPTTGGLTNSVFQYSRAFDLFEYISFNGNALTPTEKGQVKWLFTESLPVGQGGALQSAPNGTLIINGSDSVGAVPTDGDLTSAPVLSDGGLLSFWNKDFSGSDETIPLPPADGTFDYVGDITGDNLLSGPQERIVTIYIKGSAAITGDSAASFSVITTINEGDSVSEAVSTPPSGPTDPYVAVVPSSNDFANWTAFSLSFYQLFHTGSSNFTSYTAPSIYEDDLGQFNFATTIIQGNPLVTAGHTFRANSTNVAANGTAPSGTTSLTALVSGAFVGGSNSATANNAGTKLKHGLSSWERTFNTTVDGNSLYRLRTKIARDSASAARRENIRVRLGNTQTIGQGIGAIGYVAPATTNIPFLGATATDFYTYLVAKSTTTPVTSLAVSIDVYSNGNFVPAGDHGSSVVVTEYELSKTAITALKASDPGTVLFNYGAATVPATATGELSLAQLGTPASPTAFNIAATATGVPSSVATGTGTSTTNQPRSAAVSGGAINLTVGQTAGATFPRAISFGPSIPIQEFGWQWAAIFNFVGWTGSAPSNPASATDPGLIAVEEGKVYIADVYMSSPQAASGIFPTVRMDLRAGGASLEGQAVYDLGSQIAGSGTRIATAPKVYSTVLRPSRLASATPVTNANLFLNFYGSALSNENNPVPAGGRTITIHRIVITGYDDFVN